MTAAGIAVPFPDVIEAVSDTPMFLEQVLGVDGGSAGLRIVSIDGTTLHAGEATELPGIRIGGEDGGGYVFRRAIDKQLLFVPDADYSGVTSFRYTIADDFGQSATVHATLSVVPSGYAAHELLFADGTQWATVQAGMDAAIVGALALDHEILGQQPVVQVFEGDSDVPSTRFAVTGDKLRVIEPLGHGDDGGRSEDGVIHLRIVASDGEGGNTIASTFEIDVRPTPPAPVFADGNGSNLSSVEALLNWLSSGELTQSLFARDIAANDRGDAPGFDADEFHFREAMLDDTGSTTLDALAGVFQVQDEAADQALQTTDTWEFASLADFGRGDVASPSSDGGDL